MGSPAMPWENDPEMPWENDPEALEAHPEARIGPDPSPQSALSELWTAFREQLFGHPDRADARAAGIGVQPSAADMIETLSMVPISPTVAANAPAIAAGAGATRAAAGGALARVASGAGTVARTAAEHPRVVQGAIGAVTGGAAGEDLKTAVAGAAIGALLGGKGKAAREVAEAAPAAARAASRRAAAPAARAAAAPAARAAAPQRQTLDAAIEAAQRATGEADKAAGLVRQAAPAAAPATRQAAPAAANAGAEVAKKHNTLMAFAREIAKKNPKVGEKIWILLDDAGKPIGLPKLNKAGDPLRGQNTTWVKNLWS